MDNLIGFTEDVLRFWDKDTKETEGSKKRFYLKYDIMFQKETH